MRHNATSINAYIDSLPEDKKEVIIQIRDIFLKNLPKGFEERMSYGMPGFVVPHAKYPAGYHVDPKQPLPFISFAAQKNHIALYHSGVYTIPYIADWFQQEYPKYSNTKLDMGKSCIRFKNSKNIPFELIGELATKITVDEWILAYEEALKSSS